MKRPTRREENRLYRRGYRLIAGTDEVGRGAWAGPLVAAAVILPKEFQLVGLNDSKKLAAKQREKLYKQIIHRAVAWSTAAVEQQQIDRHGLSQANRRALRQSVEQLPVRPDFILVDSFNFSFKSIPGRGIVRGDATVACIAAASIIAKVTRDRMMVAHHRRYPRYHFHQHKGYGTAEHRRLLLKHGPCALHRFSFEPIKSLV